MSVPEAEVLYKPKVPCRHELDGLGVMPFDAIVRCHCGVIVRRTSGSEVSSTWSVMSKRRIKRAVRKGWLEPS